MKQKSRTAKARYLQNIVKDYIIKLYPSLTKKDIRTSLTGENSADIKLLTPTARKLFPYSVECKNRNEFKGLYKYYAQAESHSDLEPLLVIKSNRNKPLAIVDLEHLFTLLQD
tara:strand:- start:89 stop:427 length:339 start_codon:yes stop_codon:yes gene_type:complete